MGEIRIPKADIEDATFSYAARYAYGFLDEKAGEKNQAGGANQARQQRRRKRPVSRCDDEIDKQSKISCQEKRLEVVVSEILFAFKASRRSTPDAGGS